MNYFITSIVADGEGARSFDSRTFGYYDNLTTALNAVGVNSGNMHECFYNYLVIEKIPEGIHAFVEEEYWFEWKDDHWERLISKPECFNGVYNWSIG